ncbi:MAG: PspC domain-containing protein [Flavobacteriaceae bacterium]|nr:PspC domain-containing protein [Flavobacteriaceae bacterium]
MNKTININLGGIFFHIDETAYQKLKKYLDAIRRSLSDDSKGKDEILTDIEFRIGEILAGTVKDVRQVVNEQDIDSIIIIMGKPEDYIGDEEFFEERPHSYDKKNSKKLYRDTNDKFLGGVSSGLAHYFGFDVVWIRLAWLILFFGGGIGGLVYIVLWILLPEANSTAEKLEMEGEPVNISNIEKKIRAEFSNASQIVKEGIDDVTNHIKKKKYQSKVKNGSQEIVGLLGEIFSLFFRVVGKFIGIFLVFIAGATLIVLIVSAFSVGSFEILGFSENNFIHYPSFFYNSTIPMWLLTIFLFVGLAVPFILLFMLGLKILSKDVKLFSRTTKLALLGVWLIVLFGLIFSGIEFGTKFTRENTVIQKQEINWDRSKTLILKMQNKDEEELDEIYGIKTVQDDNEEKMYSSKVRLNIRESETNVSYLKIYKKANGATKNKAMYFANNIDYKYNITDNNLVLNAYFLSELKNKFQNQSIKIVLYLTKNTQIYIDKSTKNYLRYIDNIQDLKTKNMIEHYFKMTEKGLDCLDCDIDTKKTEDEKKDQKDRKIIDSIKNKPIINKNKHVKESKNGLEINKF